MDIVMKFLLLEINCLADLKLNVGKILDEQKSIKN